MYRKIEYPEKLMKYMYAVESNKADDMDRYLEIHGIKIIGRYFLGSVVIYELEVSFIHHTAIKKNFIFG